MENYFTRVLKNKRVLFFPLYSEYLPFYFILMLRMVIDLCIKQRHVVFESCLKVIFSKIVLWKLLCTLVYLKLANGVSCHFAIALGTIFKGEKDPVLNGIV